MTDDQRQAIEEDQQRALRWVLEDSASRFTVGSVVVLLLQASSVAFLAGAVLAAWVLS